MKKLPIALLTLICATMLNGCNREKLSGSEAAKMLLAEERLDAEELKGTSKVLQAAALTYVAAALMSVMELLRLLLMSGILGGSDD